ncbi:hypothetical protein NP493_1248g02030 [Ridgeia piscesae]|uniref:G-protein coupled receptors family 1 profile domain-containing protein n=1 Tax=Ridgeia piscesae TaxID=27915 RepID=A0AAD9NH13_RIDPI|nr:hypothetical protein NP493_1248g02030 [Ridgeia piscesae]
MANGTTLMSTATSVLDDVIVSKENKTDDFVIDVPGTLWRYGWPPLCMMGLVGNTLVLLVLRRDGLVRTSANVYLSALAVGDSLVLMVASTVWYPVLAWGWWLVDVSTLACYAAGYATGITLENAFTWFIVAFTAERCVVVRFPLLKLRLCTPRYAGLCCGSLLVLNIDLFFMDAIVVSNDVRRCLHCSVALP